MYSVLKQLPRFLAMAAFLWLLAKAAEHVWPASKWYIIFLFAGVWIFVFLRGLVGNLRDYGAITSAYVERRILAEDLPTAFRFISHNTTLQEVFDRVGVPSSVRTIPVSKGRAIAGREFRTFEFELPYESRVVVMPEPPFQSDCNIRAVFVSRNRDNEEWFAPIRE